MNENKKKPILSRLPKTVTKGAKRLGRGYGSGKGGHTTDRGQKGQKARSKTSLLFSGRKLQKSLLRRIPLLPGKGKMKKKSPASVVVNLSDLNSLRAGSVVDQQRLIDAGLVRAGEAKRRGVKILANGKLEKKMKIKVPISAGAKKAVEEAGGEVVEESQSSKSETN